MYLIKWEKMNWLNSFNSKIGLFEYFIILCFYPILRYEYPNSRLLTDHNYVEVEAVQIDKN